MNRLARVSFFLAATVIQPVQAQRLLADGMKELSDQLVASATQGQKHRIAVLPFRELDGESTVLGAYLAESLTTRLFSVRGLDIQERALLDKVMTEARLGSTGVNDPARTARIGSLAGVEAIGTGTITDMQSSIAMNCRMIDVATAACEPSLSRGGSCVCADSGCTPNRTDCCARQKPSMTLRDHAPGNTCRRRPDTRHG